MLTKNATPSEIGRATQIPSSPRKTGSVNMHTAWKKKVRRKETTADKAPLLSAVKKADVKLLKPFVKNPHAYSLKPLVVKSTRAASYPTYSPAMVRDNA